MDFDAWLIAAILGLIEGLTEFIPVSSTGHLILAQHWLDFTGAKADAFIIFIQLGAILAVVWKYRVKFWNVTTTWPKERRSRRLIVNLIIATLPAVVVGLPTEDFIEKHLFKPVPVAIALIVGGMAILLIERMRKRQSVASVDEIPLAKAIGVGLFQVLAILFPGTSRSGATIMGGLALGLSRTAAAEFSFFLAIPAMLGASLIKLIKIRDDLAWSDGPTFAIGFLVAFVSALLVIRWLIGYVAGHSFAPFAWYRIAAGIVVLAVGQAFQPDRAASDSFTTLERRLGIAIATNDFDLPVLVTGGEIDGKAASSEEIDRYRPLFLAEFGRYPPSLIEAAHLSRIVLCRDLSYAGQLRAAIPDFDRQTLYLDVNRGAHSPSYQRKAIHHEFFHLFDFFDDGRLLEDEEWSRLNPPGFTYGGGGETAQGNPATSLVSDEYPGFLNHYSTTGPAEDKAEIYANLLAEPETLAERAGEDGVLAEKVRRLKSLVKAHCSELGDEFWKAEAD